MLGPSAPYPMNTDSKHAYIYTVAYTLVSALDVVGYVYSLSAPQYSKVHEHITLIYLAFYPQHLALFPVHSRCSINIYGKKKSGR